MIPNLGYRDVWSRHTLLLSRDVLAHRYKSFHGGELNAGQAREIIAHLAQAREYFQSAEQSGKLVRPLLQYYGVLAFSRAIILFRTRGARESTLVQGHGLSSVLSLGDHISNVQIKTSKGTFEELLVATSNCERSKVGYAPMASNYAQLSGFMSQQIQLNENLTTPPLDSLFSLRDLLSRMPMLKAAFEESLLETARCHSAIVTIWSPDSYTSIGVSSGQFAIPASEELARALMLPTNARTIRDGRGGTSFEVPHASLAEMFELLPMITGEGLVDTFVIEPYAGRWNLSTVASLFAGSFVLSTFVRYHPTQWNALANQEKGDAVLPVLEKLGECIQYEFPVLALREFEIEKGISRSASVDGAG